MTTNDIRREVAALGFEQEIESNEIFISSLRRALKTVYTERGVHGSVDFFQAPLKPSIYIKELYHTGGTRDEIPLTGKSISFIAHGSGELIILSNDGTERRFSFSSPIAVFRKFIIGESTLIFAGEHSYTVTDVAVFSETLSDDEEKIPLINDYLEYELSSLAPDFLAVASLPEDGSGKAIDGCDICSGRLKIPYGYSGKIRLAYKRRAPDVSLDTGNEELSIPEEISHLVSLLTAAYLWLDDDADRAQYYMALYREGMAAVKLYGTRCLKNEYQDVTGWS